MKVLNVDIDLKHKSDTLHVIPLSDVHTGMFNTEYDKVETLVGWVKDTPNTYLYGLGDLADAIVPTDKRFDFDSLHPKFRNRVGDLPVAQVEYLADLFEPIADKMIAFIPGGHEDVIKRRHFFDMNKELSTRVGVPEGHDLTFMRFRFKQFHSANLLLLATHGYVAGRRRGNKVNQLEDLSRNYEADIYTVGHSHDLFHTASPRFRVAGNEMQLEERHFANTGTFLSSTKLNTHCYAESKMYPPAFVGHQIIDIKPQSVGKPLISIRENKQFKYNPI